jgi:carboxylate-amine ligase
VTIGPSVGVEEEFLLVHSSTPYLEPCAAAVIEAAERMGVRLHKEVSTAQVETNTPVCWNLHDLRRELVGLRSAAALAATRAGARLLAAGAAVAGDPAIQLADSPRYRRMADAFGPLVTEHGICGCHVHVGVADRETAVQVGNHLRPWLPTLLALTANSSIYCGRDTGYASWRSILWSRWPCSGPPPYFSSAAHYDSTVAMMIDSGAALDHGMVYWDIRPSAHLPTVEVRISDIPSTVDETVLLTGLVRGLVGTAVRALERGRTAPVVPAEALRAAYWRSAHDGLHGNAFDPFTQRPAPLAERFAALIRHIRPELEELGELQDVKSLAGKVFARGNGALRQRRALCRRDAIADVVDQAALAPADDPGFRATSGRQP